MGGLLQVEAYLMGAGVTVEKNGDDLITNPEKGTGTCFIFKNSAYEQVEARATLSLKEGNKTISRLEELLAELKKALGPEREVQIRFSHNEKRFYITQTFDEDDAEIEVDTFMALVAIFIFPLLRRVAEVGDWDMQLLDLNFANPHDMKNA